MRKTAIAVPISSGVTRGFAHTQSVVTRRAPAKSRADTTGATRSPTQHTTRGLRCQSVPNPPKRPDRATRPPSGGRTRPVTPGPPGTVDSDQPQATETWVSGGGRYTPARQARRCRWAKVKWGMSPQPSGLMGRTLASTASLPSRSAACLEANSASWP